MASLLSPRRTRGRIALLSTQPRENRPEPADDDAPSPPLGWVLVAVVGAVVSAAASWVLVAGVAVVGWLAAEPGTLAQALTVGTELWLLGNGAGASLDGVPVTLVPWALPVLIGFMVSRFAAVAARLSRDRPANTVLAVTVVAAIAYVAPLASAALLLGHPLPAVRGSVVMGAVVAAGAAWGSCRATGLRPTAYWPRWARPLPRAVLAAQLVLLAGGAALLVTSTVLHLERVERLVAGLQAGVAGNLVLLVIQLAYLPNVVVWTTSYALGAGFGLGAGSIVAPAGSQVGLLPAVPLLGALPAGAADPAHLWWLAVGVLAGAVAAAVAALTRRAARFEETSLVGGLGGVLAGAGFVGLAWLSSGGLGVDRLAHLGPPLLPLAVLAVSSLGLAGLVTGSVIGLARVLRRRRPPEIEPADGAG